MENIKFAIDYLIKNSHKMLEDNNNYATQSVNLAIEALEKQMENKEEHLTKLQEKQLEVINYYGATHQLKQLVEECGELIVPISKYRRAGQSLDIHSAPTKELNNLIEEFADIENLIEQIKLKRKFVNDGIESVKEYKTYRELDRIERRK